MVVSSDAASESGGKLSARFQEFLISRGGPFYELQERLGLLHETAARAGRRAALFVGLAWGVPLLLTLLAGTAFGPWDNHPYLLAVEAWARFFVAIALFVLMERSVEERLRVNLSHFVRAPLLAPSAVPDAARSVVAALRRRNSKTAEAVCLLLAYGITLVNFLMLSGGEDATWLISQGPDGASLTLAGWWCALVSSPLFWFLVLRWLWRHAVWALLLRDFAKLELRLVVTHPDRNGGLGFLAQYPNTFVLFVFALSSVVSAALARALIEGAIQPTVFTQVVTAWVVLVLSLFALPLTAFGKPLHRLKDATLRASAAAATRRERAVERKLFGHNMVAEVDAEAAVPEDLPDAAKVYEAAKKLSTGLFSRAALLPVAAAAILPLVAAGATLLPVKELLKMARGLLLL